MSTSPTERRDDDFTFPTAAWVAIDVTALGVLILLLWIFQPEKGLLPEPSWLIDPLAGWLLGNVLGFAAYKTFLKLPPAGMAAICLVLVALSPVIFPSTRPWVRSSPRWPSASARVRSSTER